MKRTIYLLMVLSLFCLSACAETLSSEAAAPVPEESTIAAVQESEETTLEVHKGFIFSTTDLNGNPVTEELFEGHKLILLNFWEPWCGPCVGEMPDLERIYQAYKDKGLLIVGINFTQDGTDEVISHTGVTYPLLQYTEAFYPLTSKYVPTTVFMDAAGQQLTSPTPGARSYEDWAAWIDELLAQ